MATETSLRGEWLREQVREILLEADPSAWRAEREAELRRRVRDVVAYLKRSVPDRVADPAAADLIDELGGNPHEPLAPRSSRLGERARRLLEAMETALPAESTRGRWATFVGEVHPAYEALVDVLGDGVAPSPTVRPTNYARSAFHFASAMVALTAVVFFTRGWLIAIASAFVTYAWSMELGRRVSPKMNEALMRLYGKVAHPHERYRVNSATWYATALILLAVFATRPATMAAVVVLGVADPIAASVGRRFGKHKLRAGRSLEGSLAFMVTGALAAAVVLVATGAIAWPALATYAAIAGIVGALAELASVRLDDNFTIPVAVGAVATAVELIT